VVYTDTDSDYEIALIVARMESRKDRREMLMARFFKRQVLSSNALLHYLLPEQRDNDTVRSLRNSQPFSLIRARTNEFHKSFLPYCLKKLHIIIVYSEWQVYCDSVLYALVLMF